MKKDKGRSVAGLAAKAWLGWLTLRKTVVTQRAAACAGLYTVWLRAAVGN